MGNTSEDGGSPADQFPLPEDGDSHLSEIERILSRLTASLTVPDKIAVWAAGSGCAGYRVRAGLDVEISLMQPGDSPRWKLGMGSGSWHSFVLGEGGHVYSSAVGGGWSRTVFQSAGRAITAVGQPGTQKCIEDSVDAFNTSSGSRGTSEVPESRQTRSCCVGYALMTTTVWSSSGAPFRNRRTAFSTLSQTSAAGVPRSRSRRSTSASRSLPKRSPCRSALSVIPSV